MITPLHHSINYLEIPSANLLASKVFFKTVFDWKFTDYGDEYTAFSSSGLDGGFYLSDKLSSTNNGAVLIVLFSNNLAQSQSEVEQAGGTITQAIFKFPGGERFHFTEPGGSEFAVWCTQ